MGANCIEVIRMKHQYTLATQGEKKGELTNTTNRDGSKERLHTSFERGRDARKAKRRAAKHALIGSREKGTGKERRDARQSS